jgi:hypothetical protein
MKISLILSSVAIILHEGIAADSVQVRRRLVNTVPKSGVDVITYLRRKLDSYYDTKSDDTVFLQRKMESIDDADTETVSLMPDDDFTSGSGETVSTLLFFHPKSIPHVMIALIVNFFRMTRRLRMMRKPTT